MTEMENPVPRANKHAMESQRDGYQVQSPQKLLPSMTTPHLPNTHTQRTGVIHKPSKLTMSSLESWREHGRAR